MIKHNAKLAPIVIAMIMLLTLWEGISAFAAPETISEHNGTTIICEDCYETMEQCPYCSNAYHSSEPYCPNLQSDLTASKGSIAIFAVGIVVVVVIMTISIVLICKQKGENYVGVITGFLGIIMFLLFMWKEITDYKEIVALLTGG